MIWQVFLQCSLTHHFRRQTFMGHSLSLKNTGIFYSLKTQGTGEMCQFWERKRKQCMHTFSCSSWLDCFISHWFIFMSRATNTMSQNERTSMLSERMFTILYFKYLAFLNNSTALEDIYCSKKPIILQQAVYNQYSFNFCVCHVMYIWGLIHNMIWVKMSSIVSWFNIWWMSLPFGHICITSPPKKSVKIHS